MLLIFFFSKNRIPLVLYVFLIAKKVNFFKKRFKSYSFFTTMYNIYTKPLYKNQVKRNKTEPVAKFRPSSQLWLVQPVTTYIFLGIFLIHDF